MDLTAFFVIASFSAMLTSFMTSQPEPTQVSSFQDILDRNLFVAVWKDTSDQEYLANARQGSTANKIYKNMEKDPSRHFLTKMNELEELFMDDPSALYFGSKVFFPVLSYSNDIMTLENVFKDTVITYSGFAYPPDSELTELFDYHLHKMEQSGLLQKYRQKYDLTRTEIIKTHDFTTETAPLGYQQLVALSLVFSVGITVATIIAFLEKISFL